MGLFAISDRLRPLGPRTQGKMGPQALLYPGRIPYAADKIGWQRQPRKGDRIMLMTTYTAQWELLTSLGRTGV